MNGSNLFRKISLAGLQAQYDKNAKYLLAEKIVLAHTLVHTVPEFRGMEPRNIVPLIEGEPQVEASAYPGESNMPEVTGDNTENSVPYEGKVMYDVKFHVWAPDHSARIKLIINVEAQKDFYPGYDIVTRGIFYSSRMISAQLGTEFMDSDYDNIKKTYSIWICMNAPKYAENTITGFHMVQKNIVGEMPENLFRFDIANVVLVCLSRELAEETDKLKLHRMLGVLFSGTMSISDRKKILEEEYNISMTGDMERRDSDMCNLSEAILERGLVQGREDTLLALYKEGIIKFETLVMQMNMSEEEVLNKLSEKKAFV